MKTLFSVAFAFLVAFAGLGIYARAQRAPVHESPHKELKRSCETCHVATSFREIRFVHEQTGFALDGRHSTLNCLDCHNIENFSRIEKSCASCHQDVHKGRIAGDCQRCHSSGGWTVLDAERIHAASNFPLAGRHLQLDCESCHRSAKTTEFRTASTDCFSCHRSNYESATNPDHKGSGFSTDCQSCHQSTRWRPAIMVEHDPIFPIFSGAHRNQWDNCAQCHIQPGNNKVVSCVTCHEHAQTVTDPVHQGMAGYSFNTRACLSCHPTGEAADFKAHDSQFFPIFSGRHRNQWDNCSQCHTQPGNKKVVDCLTCHEHAQTATDPVHQGMAGYSYTSQACLNCHPDGTATKFTEHDAQFFPIFSGKHRSQWDNCSQCHTQPGNKKVVSCLTCHEHAQTVIDPVHQGMNGYSYATSACLSCHPDGTATDFTEHDGQFFPIFSGKHRNQWDNCAQCHTQPGNNKVVSCLTCHKHEQTAMNTVHTGIPDYSYATQQCLTCHPTGEAGNFVQHDSAFFPIFSGKHRGKWSSCSKCHPDAGNRKVFSCLDCHEHSRTKMDSEHRGKNGYSYNSSACYSCHPTGRG